MNLTRRGFMKATGAAFVTSMAFQLTQQSPALAVESNSDWKLVNTEEYTNICCYCAGGCGSLLSGPMGAAMFQLRNIVDPETREVIKNPDRVTKPMVRRPGASEWEDITWEDAVKEIARKVKDTRDATFEETDKNGLTVNRTPAIASLGGSQENSEEEYLILKMMRSLGVIAIDNQARV